MITLSANKFIGALTNLIAYTRALDTQDTRGLDRLLDMFRGPNLPTGDGYVVRSVGIPEVTDLDTANSTILTVVKPEIKEQYIPVKEFKKVQVTINNYLMKGAFTRPEAMGELIGLILKSMYTAEKLYLYDRVLGVIDENEKSFGLTSMLEIDAPGLAAGRNEDIGLGYVDGSLTNSFKISITGIEETDDMSATERLSARTYNTKAFVRELIATIKRIERGEYNSMNGVKSLVGRDNLVCIMTDDMLASLDVDLMATLLNSEYLNNPIKVDIITISEWKVNSVEETFSFIKDSTVLLMQKDAYKYGFFYEVATTFFDPSNLNTNNWLHFAFYSGIVLSAIAGTITVDNMSFE